MYGEGCTVRWILALWAVVIVWGIGAVWSAVISVIEDVGPIGS